MNLNRIQVLEQKVIKAVELINRLREENAVLRSRVKTAQPRIQELESIVSSFKQEQEAIEKGIVSVLSKLDRLEDEVSVSGPPSSPANGKHTVLRDDETPPGAEASQAGGKPGPEKGRPPAGTKDELDIF